MFLERLGVSMADRGGPLLTVDDPDWDTIGSLPNLQTWLDPGQEGPFVRPTYYDMMGLDPWTVVGSAPGYAASVAAFGGQPGIDFRAGGAIALKASNVVATASYCIVAVMFFDNSLPTTGFQTLFKNFKSGTMTGANFTVRNRALGFSADGTAGSSAEVYMAPNSLTPLGAHIVGIDYDDTTKTASFLQDSIVPVLQAQVANGSGNTPTTRWYLGGAVTANVILSEAVIFSASMIKNPAALQLLFARLKARSGLS